MYIVYSYCVLATVQLPLQIAERGAPCILANLLLLPAWKGCYRMRIYRFHRAGSQIHVQIHGNVYNMFWETPKSANDFFFNFISYYEYLSVIQNLQSFPLLGHRE